MLPFVVEKATLNTKRKLFVNLQRQMQQKLAKKQQDYLQVKAQPMKPKKKECEPKEEGRQTVLKN